MQGYRVGENKKNALFYAVSDDELLGSITVGLGKKMMLDFLFLGCSVPVALSGPCALMRAWTCTVVQH